MCHRIDAHSDVYGVIGCPIVHSFSPSIHNTIAEILGDNIVYTAFKVNPENLESAISGAYSLGIKGLNVTVPHKQNVIKYLYGVDSLAEQVGAVNTLKYSENGYIGFNTDVYGLKSCFEIRGIDLNNKTIVILGAGGAAKAAAIMSASNNIKKLYIVNRTLNNAYSLAQNVKKYYNVDIDVLDYDGLKQLNNIDICIQTTSVGMYPNIQNTPISYVDFYRGISVVVDIIFNPWHTKFLLEASKFGCQIVNGFDMLFFQAVKAYEIWRDIKISDTVKIKAKTILENLYNQ